MSEKIQVEVRVDREIAYREDSGWGSYAVSLVNYDDYALENIHVNKYGNLSVNGVIHRLNIGATYLMTATLDKNDPKWGWSYKINRMHQDVPSTPEQQAAFIKMLVTDLQYHSIMDVYEGQDIIQMLKDDTFEYKKVYGFGEVTYPIFREKILKNLELLELHNEFPMLDYSMLRKLLGRYANAKTLADKLRENPYIMTDFAGIGFKTADEIALLMGIAEDSQFRIHAAIRFVIREVENNGDTYILKDKLVSESYKLLKLKKNLISNELPKVEDIIEIDGKYALESNFKLEVQVSHKLKQLQENSQELNFDVEDFIKRMEKKYDVTLTSQQKDLFYNIKKNSVGFLIGYAGTGKSFLQKLVIELAEELMLRFALLAPTGKASKVLKKYTKRDAFTIHKKVGVGMDEEGFGAMVVDEDFVIVDESSMCDVKLAKILLYKLVNPNVRILFIGDSFQIPSVSAGNFLFDCQQSGVFPITLLDIVFRQKEGGILDIATKTRLGEKFIEDDFVGVKKFGKNCIFVSCPQHQVEEAYLHYFNRMIKTYTSEELMVLSPTKKGDLGTFHINNVLQEIVNPKMDEFTSEVKIVKEKNEIFFRVGDRVLNNVNTYRVINQYEQEVDIMNGDTGTIIDINVESRILTIQFEKDVVQFKSSELSKLLLSACMTMHKSQGSAAKGVISISDKAHTHQLNANLLYVAWTRAEEFLVIIGQARTINAALKKFENLRRNTFLCDILDGTIPVETYQKYIIEEMYNSDAGFRDIVDDLLFDYNGMHNDSVA